MAEVDLFVGVEGGCTITKGVLLNKKGEVLARAETNGTNQWQVGLDEACRRLHALMDELLEKSGHTNSCITAAGLSLSGSDGPECAIMISEALHKARPTLIKGSKKPQVYNDSRAALETATDQGGIVLIAGTGSNCSLVETSGISYNCGGWGNMLGDEGSGYWIAWRTLKHLFDDDDGLVKCHFSLEYARKAMHEYFEIQNNFGMLKHLYTDFKKSHIARFTLKVVEGAENGDKLCIEVMQSAGALLARHVVAVANKSSPKKFPSGLTVVCMGSVWKSWKLLEDAFRIEIKSTVERYGTVKLVSLVDNGTIGAAVVGARDSGLKVPIDYTKLTNVLAVFKA